MAAIEFALLMPVLLLLYVYLVEFSRAFDEKRKVDRLASTISDIISQQSTAKAISDATVGSILAAAAPLMTPFPGSGVSATVSVVAMSARQDQTCCDVKVQWSMTQNGVLRPCSTILQRVPAGTPPQPGNILSAAVGATPSSSGSGEIVIADVRSSFPPIFAGLVPFFSNGFQRTTYTSMRNGGQLSLQSSGSTRQGQQEQVCS